MPEFVDRGSSTRKNDSHGQTLTMMTLLVLVFFILRANGENYIDDDVNNLSELTIDELLLQKRSLENWESQPQALPLLANHSGERINPLRIKGLHRLPSRKTVFDDYDEDDEDWLPKKKSKSKFSKLFEVSVTTLSFLAFGSYLICLMVSVMRQRSTDALAAVATTVSPQIQLLQQIFGANKPFPVRIPTSSFAIHPGRRRRATPYRFYEKIYAK